MINRKDFDAADISDKIMRFEAALDAGGMDAQEAFELLSAIHAELNARRGHGHAAYARYAALIEKLEHQTPGLYRKVTAAYAQGQPPAPQPPVYTFKATYRRDPAIWLTVELLASQSLSHLHSAIRDAFHLGHGHPYSFFLSGQAGEAASEYAARPAPGARDVHEASLERLPLQPGHHFLYRFEPDDESQFAVQLVGLNPPDPSGRYPRIVEKHGELALPEEEIEAGAEKEEEGEEPEEKEEKEEAEHEEGEGEAEAAEGEEKEEPESEEKEEGEEKEEAEGEEKEAEKAEEPEKEEAEREEGEAEEKEEAEHEETEGEEKEEAEHEGPEGEEPEEEAHEGPEGEEPEEEHEAEHEAPEGEEHEAPEGEGEHGGEEHTALEGEGEPIAEPEGEPPAEAETAEGQAIAGEGETGESAKAMLSGAGEEIGGGEAEAGNEAAGD